MNDLTVLIESIRTTTGVGYRPEDVEVRWESAPVTFPPEAAAYLEARWARYMEDARRHGKSLFNGPVTRMIRAAREGHHVQLVLGPADYKTFLVTCLRDRPWFLENAPACISPALGNSVLLTHGDRAFLGLRSECVSAYPDRAHLLGGVLDRLNTPDFPATVEGLVAHLQLELHEEAGIAPAELASPDEGPRLLAILRDDILAQPEAAWIWETRVPLETIGQRLDPREHAGFVLLRRGVMDEMTWNHMTPVARQSWTLWSET